MCFAKDDIQRAAINSAQVPRFDGRLHTHTYGRGFYAPALARAIKCRQRAGGGNLYICGGHSATAWGRSVGVCYMVTLYYTARGHVSRDDVVRPRRGKVD